MRKKSVARGAAILTLAAVGAKFIGACYRIPLTNLLGAEGMGVYQLVFPLFSLLLVLSSSAVPAALASLIGQGRDRERTLGTAGFALLVLSLFCAFLLVLFAFPVARLQGNPAAAFGYFALAPALPLVALLSVLRGSFQADLDMAPTALTQITENLVKLPLGLLFAFFFQAKGLAASVFGALLAIPFSEIAALLFIFVKHKKTYSIRIFRIPKTEFKEDLRVFAKTVVPLAAAGVVLPLTQVADSFFALRLLEESGGVSATAAYGIWTGPVGAFLNLPAAAAMALGTAALPSMSRAKKTRDLAGIRRREAGARKAALLVGIPAAVLFFFASDFLFALLYPGLGEAEQALGVKLTRISSLNALVLCFNQIDAALLTGLGEGKRAAISSALGGGIKAGLDLLLLYAIGIEGMAISSLIAFGVTAVFNASSLNALLGKREIMPEKSGAIALAGGIMGIMLAFGRLGSGAMAILTPLSASVYLLLLLLFDVPTRDELLSLPFGERFYHLRCRFRVANRRRT